jgi:hypothetical protein
LHPTLQLDFLTTVGAYARYGVLFATHAIGLARAGAEDLYTTVQPAGGGASHLRSYADTPALGTLLGELSYSGYTALGFDRVLIVEGITDVKTVQQLLRLYGKEHQVLVVPAGGDELFSDEYQDQLQDVKLRVAPKVAVLVDSEKSSPTAELPARRKRFIDACRGAGVEAHAMDRRAIENYLTQDAIDAALGTGYSALKPYDRLSDSPRPWSKRDNWRIAREMTIADVGSTDVGDFLAGL